MRFHLLAWLLVAVAASLYFSYNIATQHVIVGARAGRWYYSYLAAFNWYAVLIWAIATAGCVGLLVASDAVGHREWLVVLLWFGVAVAIEGLICSLAPFRFDRIFASDGANSFNTVASHFTPETMLGDFVRARKYWPLHAPSNMPGKSVLVYWLRQVSKDLDVLPWLVVAISNLGGVFMYALARDLWDRRTALHAMVLYAIVPGKMFFFPLLNVVTPVTTLLAAFLLVRFLKTGRIAYAMLFGLSIYLIVFWEPIGLVMGLLFAAWIAAAWSRGEVSARAMVWGGVAFAIGIGAAYVWMLVRFHFNAAAIVALLAGDAAKFNVDALRPYDIWIRQNLYDFLFAVGLCSAVLAAGALLDGLIRGSGISRRLTEPIVVFALALTSVVIVTDLIGINRGEVVRLWIFLACFAQIPAAYVTGRFESRWPIALVVAVTLLHDALGTDMIGFILPG